jgi:hypothetical protein
MKLIFLFIILVDSYMTSFNIIVRKNIIDSVSNFMNLNEILMKNDYSNIMRIHKFNNSSICFNYKTYSIFEDYKYNNIYLIKNKNTYLTKFSFDDYKYLFYIKTFNKSPNRTIWNFTIKYNQLLIKNKEENDKIIYQYLNRCLNKKTNDNYHPFIISLFK